MKVLLDANLPVRLRHDLPGHEVTTLAFLGWNALKNGELLRDAQAAGFDALVTGDQNLPYQQNIPGMNIRLVVVHAISNDITDLRPHMSAVARALPLMKPGEVRRVP